MTEKSKKTQTIPLENETVKISMKLIDPFPNHPFYVFDDEEMYDLTESIRKYGLITPIIVRRKQERFELISGHRRVHACRNLGHSEIACHVIEASDDEAIIMMVDSNCQRTKVLPSERAFAYKMKLEAMKRQGKRTDLTSAQVAQKSARKTSRQILAEQEGQSQDQIRRYIRLTNLVPELLEFVDLEKIKLCPAVELSYLDEEAQRDVVDQIDETDAFPSHAQTIRMRKAFELGKLSYEAVREIMNEEKPNMPSSVIANSGLIFAGKISRPDDVTIIIRKIGREERYDDRDILKWFPRSPIGWFVCRSSRNFDFKDVEPVLVRVDPLNIDPPNNFELETRLIQKQAVSLLE